MLILDKSNVLRPFSPIYLTYADAADLTPSGDFTLEFFDVVFSATTASILWNHYNATGNQRSMLLDYTSTALRFIGSTAGTSGSAIQISYTWTPSLATPYQLAVDRSGTTVRVYVDGVVGASGTISGALFNTTQGLTIGGGVAGATPFTGTAKAVRYTVGVARYAGAYTPPTLPLPTN